MSGTTNIRVSVRVRPLERPGLPTISDITENTLSLRVPKKNCQETHSFHQLNSVFGPSCSQDEMIRHFSVPLKDCILSGRSALLMAYGQTGAGKTHSLYGPPLSIDNGIVHSTLTKILQELGTASKRMQELSNSDQATCCGVSVAILEVYNDEVYDLLSSNPSEPLTMRQQLQAPAQSTSNKNISSEIGEAAAYTWRDIASASNIEEVLKCALALRETAVMSVNSRSSRAHLILEVRLQSTKMPAEIVSSVLENAKQRCNMAAKAAAIKLRVGASHLKSKMTSPNGIIGNANPRPVSPSCSPSKDSLTPSRAKENCESNSPPPSSTLMSVIMGQIPQSYSSPTRGDTPGDSSCPQSQASNIPVSSSSLSKRDISSSNSSNSAVMATTSGAANLFQQQQLLQNQKRHTSSFLSKSPLLVSKSNRIGVKPTTNQTASMRSAVASIRATVAAAVDGSNNNNNNNNNNIVSSSSIVKKSTSAVLLTPLNTIPSIPVGNSCLNNSAQQTYLSSPSTPTGQNNLNAFYMSQSTNEVGTNGDFMISNNNSSNSADLNTNLNLVNGSQTTATPCKENMPFEDNHPNVTEIFGYVCPSSIAISSSSSSALLNQGESPLPSLHNTNHSSVTMAQSIIQEQFFSSTFSGQSTCEHANNNTMQLSKTAVVKMFLRNSLVAEAAAELIHLEALSSVTSLDDPQAFILLRDFGRIPVDLSADGFTSKPGSFSSTTDAENNNINKKISNWPDAPTQVDTVGRITLVDLAGSERANATEDPARRREAVSVNTSLLALQRLLRSGGDRAGRDCKLTRLLAGRLRTTKPADTRLMVCVSADEQNAKETEMSLSFARSAMKASFSGAILTSNNSYHTSPWSSNRQSANGHQASSAFLIPSQHSSQQITALQDQVSDLTTALNALKIENLALWCHANNHACQLQDSHTSSDFNTENQISNIAHFEKPQEQKINLHMAIEGSDTSNDSCQQQQAIYNFVFPSKSIIQSRGVSPSGKKCSPSSNSLIVDELKQHIIKKLTSLYSSRNSSSSSESLAVEGSSHVKNKSSRIIAADAYGLSNGSLPINSGFSSSEHVSFSEASNHSNIMQDSNQLPSPTASPSGLESSNHNLNLFMSDTPEMNPTVSGISQAMLTEFDIIPPVQASVIGTTEMNFGDDKYEKTDTNSMIGTRREVFANEATPLISNEDVQFFRIGEKHVFNSADSVKNIPNEINSLRFSMYHSISKHAGNLALTEQNNSSNLLSSILTSKVVDLINAPPTSEVVFSTNLNNGNPNFHFPSNLSFASLTSAPGHPHSSKFRPPNNNTMSSSPFQSHTTIPSGNVNFGFRPTSQSRPTSAYNKNKNLTNELSLSTKNGVSKSLSRVQSSLTSPSASSKAKKIKNFTQSHLPNQNNNNSNSNSLTNITPLSASSLPPYNLHAFQSNSAGCSSSSTPTGASILSSSIMNSTCHETPSIRRPPPSNSSALMPHTTSEFLLSLLSTNNTLQNGHPPVITTTTTQTCYDVASASKRGDTVIGKDCSSISPPTPLRYMTQVVNITHSEGNSTHNKQNSLEEQLWNDDEFVSELNKCGLTSNSKNNNQNHIKINNSVLISPPNSSRVVVPDDGSSAAIIEALAPIPLALDVTLRDNRLQLDLDVITCQQTDSPQNSNNVQDSNNICIHVIKDASDTKHDISDGICSVLHDETISSGLSATTSPGWSLENPVIIQYNQHVSNQDNDDKNILTEQYFKDIPKSQVESEQHIDGVFVTVHGLKKCPKLLDLESGFEKDNMDNLNSPKVKPANDNHFLSSIAYNLDIDNSNNYPIVYNGSFTNPNVFEKETTTRVSAPHSCDVLNEPIVLKNIKEDFNDDNIFLSISPIREAPANDVVSSRISLKSSSSNSLNANEQQHFIEGDANESQSHVNAVNEKVNGNNYLEDTLVKSITSLVENQIRKDNQPQSAPLDFPHSYTEFHNSSKLSAMKANFVGASSLEIVTDDYFPHSLAGCNDNHSEDDGVIIDSRSPLAATILPPNISTCPISQVGMGSPGYHSVSVSMSPFGEANNPFSQIQDESLLASHFNPRPRVISDNIENNLKLLSMRENEKNITHTEEEIHLEDIATIDDRSMMDEHDQRSEEIILPRNSFVPSLTSPYRPLVHNGEDMNINCDFEDDASSTLHQNLTSPIHDSRYVLRAASPIVTRLSSNGTPCIRVQSSHRLSSRSRLTSIQSVRIINSSSSPNGNGLSCNTASPYRRKNNLRCAFNIGLSEAQSALDLTSAKNDNTESQSSDLITKLIQEPNIENSSSPVPRQLTSSLIPTSVHSSPTAKEITESASAPSHIKGGTMPLRSPPPSVSLLLKRCATPHRLKANLSDKTSQSLMSSGGVKSPSNIPIKSKDSNMPASTNGSSISNTKPALSSIEALKSPTKQFSSSTLKKPKKTSLTLTPASVPSFLNAWDDPIVGQLGAYPHKRSPLFKDLICKVNNASSSFKYNSNSTSSLSTSKQSGILPNKTLKSSQSQLSVKSLNSSANRVVVNTEQQQVKSRNSLNKLSNASTSKNRNLTLSSSKQSVSPSSNSQKKNTASSNKHAKQSIESTGKNVPVQSFPSDPSSQETSFSVDDKRSYSISPTHYSNNYQHMSIDNSQHPKILQSYLQHQAESASSPFLRPQSITFGVMPNTNPNITSDLRSSALSLISPPITTPAAFLESQLQVAMSNYHQRPVHNNSNNPPNGHTSNSNASPGMRTLRDALRDPCMTNAPIHRSQFIQQQQQQQQNQHQFQPAATSSVPLGTPSFTSTPPPGTRQLLLPGSMKKLMPLPSTASMNGQQQGFQGQQLQQQLNYQYGIGGEIIASVKSDSYYSASSSMHSGVASTYINHPVVGASGNYHHVQVQRPVQNQTSVSSASGRKMLF